MFHPLSLRISRFFISLIVLLVVLPGLAAFGTASAQDRRQNAPGEFDFYVLSLSWSPSFCAAAEERGNSGRSQAQCGERPFSFVVHGLWPQYDRGFPEYCKRPSPRPRRHVPCAKNPTHSTSSSSPALTIVWVTRPRRTGVMTKRKARWRALPLVTELSSGLLARWATS